MPDKPRQPIEELAESELFQKVGDICAAVNTVTDARELLEVSLEKTMELFGAQRGSIFILSDNGKDLVLKIAQGMEVKEEEELVKHFGEGVVGRVAESKKPIFVNDIASDKRFMNYQARSSYKTSSFICAPLLIKDKLIGVINITDKGSGSEFGKNELQLLDFLSAQIALNFRRIELYNKFRAIMKESQNLKDELGKSAEEKTYLEQQMVAQEKLATIGKLAGGIAHEFNNPLDGVTRYTNLCLEHVKEEDVVRGYLLEVKNGLKRMANIVKSLLACSRNIKPSMQDINTNAAIEQALQSVQTDIVHKDITVEMDLAPDVPDIHDQGFERIIMNLLRNAVDSIDSGGKINISSSFEGGELRVEIEDTGCGLRNGEEDRIFDPFYTTKDIDKGCGLGLTIVSEIVKSYNGQIRIKSKEGKGTLFIVTIPAEYEKRTEY